MAAIDSVEAGGDTWVRGAGFPQAWEKYEVGIIFRVFHTDLSLSIRFEDRPRAQL